MTPDQVSQLCGELTLSAADAMARRSAIRISAASRIAMPMDDQRVVQRGSFNVRAIKNGPCPLGGVQRDAYDAQI